MGARELPKSKGKGEGCTAVDGLSVPVLEN